MSFAALANASAAAPQLESSADGITWTAWASATDHHGGLCITFGIGLFVALCLAADGNTSIALTSPDGVVWTQHAVPQPNVEYSGVTYSADLKLFVAIDSGNGTNAKVITSPDGATWTLAATIPQGNDTQF